MVILRNLNFKIELYMCLEYLLQAIKVKCLIIAMLTLLMANFIMPETHQPIIVDYLLCLPFKGPCRTLGIYFR